MAIQDIKWTDDLSVGVSAIDDDHKNLIRILNMLFVATSAGEGELALENTLSELEIYTLNHFDREEQLMADHGYPYLEAHQFQHQRLLKELHEYTDKLRESGTAGLSDDVVAFLKTWLTTHIKKYDHDYAAYIS